MLWQKLDFKELIACHLIAEHGSLRKAAIALGLTAPAISARIKSLEGELGVTLFDRLANKMVLTASGQQFCKEIAPIFAQVEQAIRRTQESAAHRRSLSLSIGSTLAPLFVPKILNLLAGHAGVALSVQQNGSLQTAKLIDSGKVDIGIGYQSQLASNLVSYRLSGSGISFFCAGNHPLARRRKIGLNDVADFNVFLVQEPSELRARVLAGFTESGVAPCSVTSVGSCQVAIAFAARSQAVAIVHETCSHGSDLRSVTRLKVSHALPGFDLSLFHRPNWDVTPEDRALIAALAA